jgi:hypothetical protein
MKARGSRAFSFAPASAEVVKVARSYTSEQKQQALELYSVYGPCRATKDIGIPKSTIIKWAKAAGLKPPTENIDAAAKAREARIAVKRAAIKERILEEAAYCLRAIHNEHIDFKSAGPAGPVQVTFPVAPAAAVQHYATAFAIFIDKFRLENGEVTGREELKHGFDFGHLTDDELGRQVGEVLSQAEGITRGILPETGSR